MCRLLSRPERRGRAFAEPAPAVALGPRPPLLPLAGDFRGLAVTDQNGTLQNWFY